ncbi:MAG TPA: hypothetical protein GXZ90_02160 [Clostridiales bacterium]|nr:hypothetical protein [Clostridiales bacterium]
MKNLVYFSLVLSLVISYVIILKLGILESFEIEIMNLIITVTLIPYIMSRYFENKSRR